MPTNLVWIYSIPSWLFFSATAIVLVAIATGGLVLFRRVVPQRDEMSHNDVAGPIVGTIGTILAVVLSFLLIGNWQEYDAAGSTMAQEAASVADVYHVAATLPQPVSANVRALCKRYVDAIVAAEWPAMRTGGRSEAAAKASIAILHAVASFEPKTQAQQALQQTMLTSIVQFQDGRRTRLFDNDQGIPIIFWAGNFLLAAVTIFFCYLFRVRNERMHLLMTGALAVAIATLMVITAEFDYPFRGDTQIQPGPWLHLEQVMASSSLN